MHRQALVQMFVFALRLSAGIVITSLFRKSSEQLINKCGTSVLYIDVRNEMKMMLKACGGLIYTCNCMYNDCNAILIGKLRL